MPTQPPTLSPKLERPNTTTFCDHGHSHGVCFGASSKSYHQVPPPKQFAHNPNVECPSKEGATSRGYGGMCGDNMNLTPPQKELLRWHFHLCHQGFDSLQRLLHTGHLGNSPLTHAAAKCDIPTCSTCEFAKVKRRPTTTKQQLPVSSKTHAVKRDQLYPGQRVSMDHFMVTERGHLYTSTGKTTSDLMYVGSCIFVDHATGG